MADLFMEKLPARPANPDRYFDGLAGHNQWPDARLPPVPHLHATEEGYIVACSRPGWVGEYKVVESIGVEVADRVSTPGLGE